MHLIDMGFAVIGPLAPHCSLISGSCSSARVFALRFFQASPHGEWLFHPCASLSLLLYQDVKRTSTFKLSNMLGTPK